MSFLHNMSILQRKLHQLIKYVPLLLQLSANRYLYFQSQVFNTENFMTFDDSEVVADIAGNHTDGTAVFPGNSGIWEEEPWAGISQMGNPWGNRPEYRSFDADRRHSQDADREMDDPDTDGEGSNPGDNHAGDNDMGGSDTNDGYAQDDNRGTSGSENFNLGVSNSEDTDGAASSREGGDTDPESSDSEEGDADMKDRNSKDGDVDSEDDNSEDSDAGEDDPASFLKATCRKKQVASLVRYLCYCSSPTTNPP